MVEPSSAYRKQSAIAVLAIVAIALHLILRYATSASTTTANWPLWIALALGGGPLLWELGTKVIRGEFGADLIAGVSIFTAILLGEYLAGTLVVLMLSGGEALNQLWLFVVAPLAGALIGALFFRMELLEPEA